MKLLLPLAVIVCIAPAWAQNPVTVRVLDEGGKPITGAVVEVRVYTRESPELAAVSTDETGKATFSLPNNDEGKPAPAAFTAGAKDYSFASEISAEGKAVEIRLARGQSWRGKVVDEQGAPLENARIVIRGAMKFMDFGNSLFIESDAIKALYSASSQSDGTFEIAGLPANKQLFYRVSLPGFAPLSSQSGRVENPETFKLVRSGALRGRALDIVGEPLAGIQVFATSRTASSMEVSDQVPTDANGAFAIDGLPSGIYELHGDLTDAMPFLLSNLQGVRVVAGATATAGEWRAIKGAEIRGLVRDAVTKKPVAGAHFAAQTKADEKSGDDSAWATSDATGHFVLRVLPGNYRVRVGGAAPGYLRASTIQSAQPTDATPAQISFELQSAPVVRGITRDESGAPVKAQLLISPMGQPLDTDAQGRWQYEPQDANDITFGGGEDDDGYFEILSPKRVDFPAKSPIVVTVRHKPWQSLAGRVVTPDGAPVEGAKVTANFGVLLSDNISRGGQSIALSDADGRYVLTRLRDSRRPNMMGTEVEVTAKKDGFQFKSGGAVTRAGKEPRISDFVFAPLSAEISGTTQAGARVVVAGRETRADDAGRFRFEALPDGKNTVYAAKDDLFGSAPSTQQPLEIALSRPAPQSRNEALARELWANNVAGKADENVLGLDDWQKSEGFEAQLRTAQKSGEEWQIASALSQWKPSDGAPTLALAREILAEMKPSEARTDAYLQLAINSEDADFTERALELAKAQFDTKTAETRTRERQLYLASVLIERRDGADAGAFALRTALAYTLQTHPEQSRVEGAMQTAIGRNEALMNAASRVAAGSPALLRELLGTIETGSGFAVRALAEAIPVLAQAHGLEAATPFLEELAAIPAPTLDMKLRYQSFEPDWAFGQAVHDMMPFVGPTDAAAALEWARKVEGDEQRARALASAAHYQSLEVAAPLLREAVEKIGTEDAPRVAAYAYGRDQTLGLELFEVARRKADDEMKSDMNYRNSWIPFAFYTARANPAQARLILEREWAKGRQAKADDDALASIAIAMAPANARRAAEMASELTGYWGLNAQVKAARYLVANEKTRTGFYLDRIGSREAWDEGTLQW